MVEAELNLQGEQACGPARDGGRASDMMSMRPAHEKQMFVLRPQQSDGPIGRPCLPDEERDVRDFTVDYMLAPASWGKGWCESASPGLGLGPLRQLVRLARGRSCCSTWRWSTQGCSRECLAPPIAIDRRHSVQGKSRLPIQCVAGCTPGTGTDD